MRLGCSQEVAAAPSCRPKGSALRTDSQLQRLELQYWRRQFMFSLSAIVLDVVAVVSVALPLYLLYQFRSQAWYWHVMAVVVALVIGLMPGTALLQTENGSLLYGFWFLVLMIWGIGGLILRLIPYRWRREKHA